MWRCIVRSKWSLVVASSTLTWGLAFGLGDEKGGEGGGSQYPEGYPEISGSFPFPDAIPLAGSHQVFVDDAQGIEVYLGNLVIEEATGTPTVYPVSSSPAGPGSIVEDASEPDHYVAYFDALGGASNPIAIKYNADALRFDMTLGGAPAYFAPVPYETYPQQAPPGVRIATGLFWNPRPGVGFTFTDGGLLPWISSIEWIQFVKATLTFGGTAPDGTPFSGTAPGGFALPTTGNGGGAHGQNPATGQGFTSVAGDTWYVDSVTPSVPGYVQSGGAGSNGPGATSSMQDSPSPANNLPAAAAAAAAAAGFPAGSTLQWIHFHLDFATYLVVDGVVVYEILWHYDFHLDLQNGSVTSGVGIDLQGPTNSMDAAHQNALNGYQSGSFAGAPG